MAECLCMLSYTFGYLFWLCSNFIFLLDVCTGTDHCLDSHNKYTIKLFLTYLKLFLKLFRNICANSTILVAILLWRMREIYLGLSIHIELLLIKVSLNEMLDNECTILWLFLKKKYIKAICNKGMCTFQKLYSYIEYK